MCVTAGQSYRKSVSNSLLTGRLLQCHILCPFPFSHVYSLILLPPDLTSTLCNFHKMSDLFEGFLRWGENGMEERAETMADFESLVSNLKVKVHTYTRAFGN